MINRVPNAAASTTNTQTQVSSGQGLLVVGSSPPQGKSPPWAKENAGSKIIPPANIIEEIILKLNPVMVFLAFIIPL